MAVNEQISEADVLGGLLVHSADNYADLLATWDAGSIPAFVAKMNATAARSAWTTPTSPTPAASVPGSESTASDLLKVAALDMANPTFAAFVQQSSVTLPVAGTISTYTPLLGVQGVIGVKSGFTSQAGGGDVLAVDRTVHGKQVLLLSAVTGQTGPLVLAQAGLHALALVDAMTPFIGSTEVLPRQHVAAQVSEAGATIDASTVSSASMLTWPGVTATRVFVPAQHVREAGPPGHDGRERRRHPGHAAACAVPVQLDGDIPPPDASPAPVLTRLA